METRAKKQQKRCCLITFAKHHIFIYKTTKPINMNKQQQEQQKPQDLRLRVWEEQEIAPSSMIGEEWRHINDASFYDLYAVSNYGRVYSFPRLFGAYRGFVKQKKGRIITPQTHTASGMHYVMVQRNGTKKMIYLHTMVYDCFSTTPRTEKQFIHFRDGNKGNCRYDNLFIEDKKIYSKSK